MMDRIIEAKSEYVRNSTFVDQIVPERVTDGTNMLSRAYLTWADGYKFYLLGEPSLLIKAGYGEQPTLTNYDGKGIPTDVYRMFLSIEDQNSQNTIGEYLFEAEAIKLADFLGIDVEDPDSISFDDGRVAFFNRKNGESKDVTDYVSAISDYQTRLAYNPDSIDNHSLKAIFCGTPLNELQKLSGKNLNGQGYRLHNFENFTLNYFGHTTFKGHIEPHLKAAPTQTQTSVIAKEVYDALHSEEFDETSLHKYKTSRVLRALAKLDELKPKEKFLSPEEATAFQKAETTVSAYRRRELQRLFDLTGLQVSVQKGDQGTRLQVPTSKAEFPIDFLDSTLMLKGLLAEISESNKNFDPSKMSMFERGQVVDAFQVLFYFADEFATAAEYSVNSQTERNIVNLLREPELKSWLGPQVLKALKSLGINQV
jgi:hypothetical protein